MPRPKPAEEAADDGWIWGSSRGGGGAPLKSKDGNTITNLKLVIGGAVEPDHSPTGSPNRSSHGSDQKTSRRVGYDDDNYDNNYGGGRRDRRQDNYDPYYDNDRDDRRGGNRGRGGGRGDSYSGGEGRGSGRKITFRDDAEDDYPNARSGYGGRNGGRGGGGRGGYDDNRDRRDRGPDISDRNLARHRSPIDTSYDSGYNNIPGLNGTGSPKKFMGALREMTSSEDPRDRDQKISKDLTYQKMLRAQIEEKKYAKDVEVHEDAMRKQKELEEYLATHYKGKIPPHVTQKVRTDKKKLQDDKYELEDRKRQIDSGKGIVSKPTAPRRQERSFDDFSDDEDFRRGGRRDAGGGSGRGGRGRMNMASERDDDFGRSGGRGGRGGGHSNFDDDYDSDPDSPRGPRGGRVADRHNVPPKKDWVSQTEYDELSALCDTLLKEKDDLQSDLEKSRTPQRERGGGGMQKRPTVKGVGPDGRVQPRAKSQQQLHRDRPAQNGPGTFGASRPKSIQAVNRRGASAQQEVPNTARSTGSMGKPSVAFGRIIKATKPNDVSERITGSQKKVMKSGGAATGRLMMKANNESGNSMRNRGPRDDYDEPPMAPRGGYGASPANGKGGFGSLAAKARGGPVIVSYDDDLGGSTCGVRGGGGARQNARRSVELDGSSEYLKIGGEEVDLISGDQLDRLLVQARRTRGN